MLNSSSSITVGSLTSQNSIRATANDDPMKSLLLLLATLLGLYLCLVVLVYFFQRSLMYQPGLARVGGVNTSQLKSYEIEVKTQQATLRGWLINPQAPNLLLYYGGNAENLSVAAHDFLRYTDYAVLFLNYRGYGSSTGSPSEAALVADALAAYDQLAGSYDRVVLYGRSLGTGIAVQVAAQRQVAGLILVAPYDSMVAVARKIYPFLPVSLLLQDRYDSIKLAPDITVPALFLVGADDSIIPQQHARALADAWGGPVDWHLLAGAGHNTLGSQREFNAAVANFLADTEQAR